MFLKTKIVKQNLFTLDLYLFFSTQREKNKLMITSNTKLNKRESKRSWREKILQPQKSKPGGEEQWFEKVLGSLERKRKRKERKRVLKKNLESQQINNTVFSFCKTNIYIFTLKNIITSKSFHNFL